MRFSFQLQNTDEFEATATVTMKISEWKELYRQMREANLDQKWPSADLVMLLMQYLLQRPVRLRRKL